jgi:hypothetical protein
MPLCRPCDWSCVCARLAQVSPYILDNYLILLYIVQDDQPRRPAMITFILIGFGLIIVAGIGGRLID